MTSALNKAARVVVEEGHLAHLVTLGPDGSPNVAIVWIGLDGDEIVSGHLMASQRKLANIRRDPRVVLSLESGQRNDHGLDEYLTIRGTARVTEGGAPELLQRLAQRYLGPGVVFPPMPNPPPGFVVRTTVERVGGVGPWT